MLLHPALGMPWPIAAYLCMCCPACCLPACLPDACLPACLLGCFPGVTLRLAANIIGPALLFYNLGSALTIVAQVCSGPVGGGALGTSG